MIPDYLPVISITFKDDVRLTFLQILSFDRLYDLSRLNRFIVILNDRDDVSCNETRVELEKLLFEKNCVSSEMKSKLEFVTWEKIFHSAPRAGMRDQQAIKLAVSRIIEDPFYLLLDGKNHFVRPANLFDFFEDGKPKLPLWRSVAGFWERCLIPSVDVMEVRDDAFKQMMWPSVTPYVMYTQYAREVCQFLENKYSCPMPQVFTKTESATEFLMYYAYVASRYGVDSYTNAVQPNRTLFTVGPEEDEKVVALISKVKNDQIAMFGLHRNRIPKLSTEQRELIDSLWKEHLLFPWEDSDWFMFNQKEN